MRTWRRSLALAQQKSRVLPRSGEGEGWGGGCSRDTGGNRNETEDRVCCASEQSNGQPVKGHVQSRGCLFLSFYGRNNPVICMLMNPSGGGGSLDDFGNEGGATEPSL